MSITCSVFTCSHKRQCYTRQAIALIERRIAYRGNTFGYRDARQARATIERIRVNHIARGNYYRL